MSLWQKIRDHLTIDDAVEEAIRDAKTLPRMALLWKYYKVIGLTGGVLCVTVGFVLGRLTG